MKTKIGILLLMVSFLKLNSQTDYFFNLKVFLEGPFNGTTMNTDLNAEGMIPLLQPFNVSPWNYNGTELVAVIPNTSIVDWVLVELRETSGDASTATLDKQIHRQAAFLKLNGDIVGLDGSSLILYNGLITSNLYVIIRHLNHLAMMSSGPLPESGGIYTWNFTNQLSRAYLYGQKEIGTGYFGMVGGDCDANDTVQMADHEPMWEVNAGKQSYSAIDLNLDTQINNPDKDDVWLPNMDAFARIPSGIPFTCGGLLVDDRDGQAYNTIQIGTQCWMAENLNIGTMIQGSSNQTNNSILEKYCYNNNSSICDVYGGLYQWDEMMQYTTQQATQGICPTGWHIPSYTEFTTLLNYLDGANVAGGKMKEAGYAHWLPPNYGATNSSGFTALPGGYCANIGGQFTQIGVFATLWTSTESSSSQASKKLLASNAEYVGNISYPKTGGASLRCIKN